MGFKVLAGVLISHFLVTQSYSQSPEGEATRFRVAGFGNSFFEGLKYQYSEEATVELSFTPDRRSRNYLIPEVGERIRFFREEVDESGKTKRIIQAEAKVLSEVKNALYIFIFQGEDANPPFEIISLDESSEAFGPGDYRVLNLAGLELKAQLGPTLFDADLGLTDELALPLDSDVAQPLRFAMNTDAGWKILHSTKTRPDRSRGTLLVLKPPLEEGSFRLRVDKLR